MKLSFKLCLCAVLGVGGCSKVPDPSPSKSTPRVSNTEKIPASPIPAQQQESTPLPSEPQHPAVTTTEEANENSAPIDLELAPHEVQFEYDKVKYTVFAPRDARFKLTQTPIYVSAGLHFNMIIELGTTGMEAIGLPEGSEIVHETPVSAIVKKKTIKSFNPLTHADSHEFFLNRTFGHRDFTFRSQLHDYVDESNSSKELIFTLADCQAMMNAAEQMTLAEELPNEPADILELFGSTVHREDGSVKQINLDVIRTTDSTLELLKGIPSLVSLNADVDMQEATLNAVLRELPNLEHLGLDDSTIIGAAIPDLQHQPQLKSLSVGGRNSDLELTDADVERLTILQSLKSFDIGSYKLTGEMLQRIPVFPNLTELQVTRLYYDLDTADTTLPGGMAHFAKFPKLQIVRLNDLKTLTDDALRGLAEISGLRELHLYDSPEISSAGVAHLKAQQELEVLDLAGTKVDDDAVAVISQFKSLKQLGIRRTQITDDGYEQLKNALPDCEIDFK